MQQPDEDSIGPKTTVPFRTIFSIPNIRMPKAQGTSKSAAPVHKGPGPQRPTVVRKRPVVVRRNGPRPVASNRRPKKRATSLSDAPVPVVKKRARMEYTEPPKRPTQTLFVEFKEENGWEKGTWCTYIPYEPNKKLLPVLRQVIRHVNYYNAVDERHLKQHQEWEEKTKERSKEYMKKFRETGDPLMLALSQHVMGDLSHGKVCAACTKFTINLNTLYTEAECLVRSESMDEKNPSRYMGDCLLMGHEQMDRAVLAKWCKKVRTKDPKQIDDVFGALYKGGLTRTLFGRS